MKRFSTFKLHYLLLFVILYSFSNISCSQKPKDIYNDMLSEMDLSYLNEELKMLNIPLLKNEDVEITYKFAHKDSEKEPVRCVIYGMKIEEKHFHAMVDSLKNKRILINEPLSEHIMFRFKLGDGKTFRINHLKPGIRSKTAFEKNLIKDEEGWVNRKNCYYFFQDFTVYSNPEKTRRKHKSGKLVFLDLDSHILIFYNDYVNYR